MEYTVHFQRGSRVGARSLRMERVEANSRTDASKKAQALFPTFRAEGYKVVRIDYFDDETGRLVIDY